MLKWREVEGLLPQGIIVASDEKQEWLLPWWWDNYSQHNDFPVTFIDFGLSSKAKDWCRERGELIELPVLSFEASRDQALEDKAVFWESIYEGRNWWDKRILWHKKPIAMLQSPYKKSLWLDTDCEVKGNLGSVFSQILSEDALLICPELDEMQEFDRLHGHLLKEEVLFNSGVVGFIRGSTQVMNWALSTVSDHGAHWSDQNLLSRLIHENKWPVQILDRIYNWRECTHGKNPEVKITHWVGESGKFFISMKIQNFL